jgi:hypothetical protein
MANYMTENCAEWMHDIEVYFELPWENTTAPEELLNYVERENPRYLRFYRILALNGCSLASYNPEWHG